MIRSSSSIMITGFVAFGCGTAVVFGLKGTASTFGAGIGSVFGKGTDVGRFGIALLFGKGNVDVPGGIGLAVFGLFG